MSLLPPPHYTTNLCHFLSSMNVAMISRITIHLRKECNRRPNPLTTRATYEHTSLQGSGMVRSPVLFDHPERLRESNAPQSFLLVEIKEQSVVHDDHGTLISVKAPEMPLQLSGRRTKRASWEGEEEWIEHAPVDMGGGRRNDAS